jgi:periplasmic protein TonB
MKTTTRILLTSSFALAVFAGLAIHAAAQPADKNHGQKPDAAAQPATPAASIYNLNELDKAPVVRHQARPVYPPALRKAKITGEAVVGFIVDPAGNVQDAFAVRSSQREFEAAAVTAVAQWKFHPGQKDGKAVATRMQVPIVFSISEN